MHKHRIHGSSEPLKARPGHDRTPAVDRHLFRISNADGSVSMILQHARPKRSTVDVLVADYVRFDQWCESIGIHHPAGSNVVCIYLIQMARERERSMVIRRTGHSILAVYGAAGYATIGMRRMMEGLIVGIERSENHHG